MTPQDWRDSFGGRLTHLRHAARLTQEQLADRSGLSVRAISSLECGARHPRRMTVERLATGLGLAPADRHQLIDAATVARFDPPPAGPLGSLVGRDADVALLRAHVRGEGPPLILYVGEPGIGKSRLLAEARRLAPGPVLGAAARRGDGLYAPVADALTDVLPWATLTARAKTEPGLLALFPELPGDARPAPEHHRRLVFHSAQRLLADAARPTGRVVLLLDDMQWAEASAADLLAHLIERIGPRLRVVAAVRSGDLAPHGRLAQVVADLARVGLVRHRPLAPLSDEDAMRLVRRHDVVQRAGGLPLFLTELAAAGEIPDHLLIALRQQLADLPEDTRVLLQRIATGPPVMPVERLVSAGDTAPRVLAALEPAIRRHILDDTAHGFRFRYPLFREVLVADLGPTRRRLLRSAVAVVAAARHLSRVKLI